MASDTKGQTGSTTSPIFIDLGKRSRKAIKKLRDCDGKLMVRISDTLESLVAGGQIKKDSQTIVVIVQERRPRKKGLFGW